MGDENSLLILQMTHALVDGMDKLESAHNRNNYVDVEKAKKAMLEMQERLAEILND